VDYAFAVKRKYEFKRKKKRSEPCKNVFLSLSGQLDKLNLIKVKSSFFYFRSNFKEFFYQLCLIPLNEIEDHNSLLPSLRIMERTVP